LDETNIPPGRLIGLVLIYLLALFVLSRLIFKLEVIQPEGRTTAPKSQPATVQPSGGSSRERPSSPDPASRIVATTLAFRERTIC